MSGVVERLITTPPNRDGCGCDGAYGRPGRHNTRCRQRTPAGVSVGLVEWLREVTEYPAGDRHGTEVRVCDVLDAQDARVLLAHLSGAEVRS